MTEIATRDDSGIEQHAPPQDVNALSSWAAGARAAASIAQSLARTPFVPASLRDRDANVTAANVTAAVLTGYELGLQPMAALRSLDIIQGVPALRAISLRALVLSHGHEIEVQESTETRARVRGRRKGSDEWQTSTWTVDRARALGLLGKDNWKKQPGAMLVARATGECARLVAADVILGVPYVAEELQDGIDAQDAAAASSAPAARSLRRAAPPRGQSVTRGRPVVEAPLPEPDEPPLDDEPAPQPEPEPEPEPQSQPTLPANPISSAQTRMLHALYRDLGIEDRDDRLADVSAIVGRDVASANDLTAAEASRVIDALTTRLNAAPDDDGPDAQTTGQPRKWCSDTCRTDHHNAARRTPRLVRSAADRVRDKLAQSATGCLEFTGYRNASGYGVVQTGGTISRTRLAHRVIWEDAHGHIPDGLCVRHSCDNPACCNLAHLSLGTHADNMADRDARGRTLKGEALRKARWAR